MATSKSTFQKRQKEMKRQEKRQMKAEKRAQKKLAKNDEPTSEFGPPLDEMALPLEPAEAGLDMDVERS